MSTVVWCNGEFREGPLAISPSDRGLTHGLGVFETLLAVDGQVRALHLHLGRMATGAAALGLDGDRIDVAIIDSAITTLLDRTDLAQGRARIRISLSGGSGDLRTLSPGSDSLLWITASRAADPPKSVSLITASFRRNESSPLAGIKALSYAENLVALNRARLSGADEALFYNTRGELCEATTSNIFLVRHDKLLTPPLSSGCLPGTMRQRVLDFCQAAGIAAEETTLTKADLAKASQFFITSAIRGAVPVSTLDGQALSQGAPALLTRLQAL